ncbi:MAG: cardiolipin synthase [Bacteroidales bacterium]|nr:cardiolipin synthase [Bacteroidales bacterium]
MMKSYILIAGIVLFFAAWILWVTRIPRDEGLGVLQTNELLDLQTEGNHITTYTSFTPMYNDMLTDIQSAQHYAYVQFFKIEADTVGQNLGSTLASCAAKGVDTRLMYDDLMCCQWHWYYNALKRQGVHTAGFGKVHLPFFKKHDYYRNHRKTVVVDGRVAYVGGMNIADRYQKGLGWGCWRDTMIRIEGPAAAAVQASFAIDWHFATGKPLNTIYQTPTTSVAGSLPVRILTSGPLGHGPKIMHYTSQLLNDATRYVYLETPYFIPTKEIKEALCRAAQRGVDVRLLVPPRGDRGETTQLASHHYFADMMAAGVKIGTYGKGFLHSKTIVSDDKVAMVGSCNIDPRSHLLCEEIVAVIDSSSYAAELKEVFLADEHVSTYIDPIEWESRSLAKRCGEALAYTIASQL